MKEIKFRVWDNDLEIMSYSNTDIFITFSNDGICIGYEIDDEIDDYEMAAGYEDGAEACLNNLSRDKLEAFYVLSRASEDSNTDYEKGYRSAIKDYLLEKYNYNI